MLPFALAAGMLAAINPCGFAMLPAYLALVTRQSLLRALAATCLMASGFLAVFGVFGLAIAPLGTSLQAYMPAATVIIGIAMATAGAWTLAGKEIPLPRPHKGAPTTRLTSMVGYGIAYAVVSLSCTIGPFLAVTSATFRTGSVITGIAAYLTYAVGMAIVVGILAVSAALAGSAAARVRHLLPYVHRLGGAILLLAGLYIAYYGTYELRLFHTNTPIADPIVDAVTAFQSTLANWIDNLMS